jgi:hypothetical protein
MKNIYVKYRILTILVFFPILFRMEEFQM